MALGHGLRIPLNGLLIHIDMASLRSFSSSVPAFGTNYTINSLLSTSSMTLTGVESGFGYSTVTGFDYHLNKGTNVSNMYFNLDASNELTTFLNLQTSLSMLFWAYYIRSASITIQHLYGQGNSGSIGKRFYINGSDNLTYVASHPTQSTIGQVKSAIGFTAITNTWGLYSARVSQAASGTSTVTIGYNLNFEAGTAFSALGTAHQGGNRILRFEGGSDWNGRLGMVSLYNRTISDTEIQNYYQATKGRFGL